jgi:MoxR-like ATPase
LLRFHQVVLKVPVAEDVVRYAVRIAAASRPAANNPRDFINEWVTWGAGLRASQYMVLGAKARALLNGKSHVSFEDIRALALPVLRHRILINYRAEAEGVVIGGLVDRLLKSVKES